MSSRKSRTYIYIYIYVCVCVCVCVWGGEWAFVSVHPFCVYLFTYLSQSVQIYLSIQLSNYLSLSFSLFISLFVCLSLCLSLSLSLNIYIYIYIIYNEIDSIPSLPKIVLDVWICRWNKPIIINHLYSKLTNHIQSSVFEYKLFWWFLCLEGLLQQRDININFDSKEIANKWTIY